MTAAVNVGSQKCHVVLDCVECERKSNTNLKGLTSYHHPPPLKPSHISLSLSQVRVTASLPPSILLATLPLVQQAAMTSALSSINEAYAHGSQAPLDLAIVVSWEAIMSSLMTVDADLLRLVHLGNRSTRLPGAGPLRPGDVCSASARVRSVKISETGKTVVVKAIIVRHAEGAEGSSSTAAQDYDAEAGTPIIEVESSFFFRGRFKDFSNCFDERDDTYVVEVKTLQDASVLMAKEWFNWSAASPLKPGAKLELRLHSDLRHATDSSSYSAVNVTGAAYMRDHNGGLYEVGQVAYEADGKR